MKKPTTPKTSDTTPDPKLVEQQLREQIVLRDQNLRVIRNQLTKLAGQITVVLGE